MATSTGQGLPLEAEAMEGVSSNPPGQATESEAAGETREASVSDLSHDLQTVVNILQKTLGEKIDEIKESLGGRVSKLEEKIDNVEEKLHDTGIAGEYLD